MISLPPIGMRIIKSAIAVIISAVFMEHIVGDTPFFACIGAVVAMEKTMNKSFEAAIIRNVGTFVGGILGMVVSFLTDNVAIQALGIIPVIYIINLLKKHPSIIPGCIVFFAVVYLNDASTGWIYGIRRIIETFIGSVIGLGVNSLIKSPREEIDI